MIEDDFYATIKLKNGEEIFAKVIPTEEDNKTLLLVNNPVIISEYKSRGVEGYKLEPWLKTTTEDLFILNVSDILTMTETKDIEMILMHQQFTEKISNIKNKLTSENKNNKLNRKMGYISNINEAKKILEDIYNNS
jgi:hypothetical protein